MATLDYAQSGVDRDAADRLVESIAGLAKSTYGKHKPKLKASIGGYASLYALDSKRWLAASTDGVGTKLKLAFELHDHTTVGIDLVAMSVNDLLCVGARPLFFLDYFATGKLNSDDARGVLQGIVEGCKQAGCALVGGETAEMPEFYQVGEYDLGGFAVGLVDAKRALPSKTIKPGDVLIGLSSSGCHSNGYSLLRKLLPPAGEERTRLARALLTPTRIYAKSLLPLIDKGLVKGLAHITGSGFLNVPRMSVKVNYEIELPPESERPIIFQWVRAQSGLSLHEMCTTLNTGIGMVMVVDAKKQSAVLKQLKKSGERAWVIGKTSRRDKNQTPQSLVKIQNSGGSGESCVLEY
jgi:phosphoribosylformylglycinamidine cyclo-ligase